MRRFLIALLLFPVPVLAQTPPDSSAPVEIKNKSGQTVETIVPNNNGGYVVRDKWGWQTNTLTPNTNGGYDIKDNWGRVVGSGVPTK
jgi:hypothetical protein